MPTLNEAKRLIDLTKMYRMIPRDHLVVETDLLVTKWPEYRFQSPFDATLAFANAYREAYKNAVERHFDREESLRTEPISKLNVASQNSGFTQMWIARQHADLLGMPYSWYLEFCFDFATRRRRHYLPRPNQLRLNEKSDVAWSCEMEKRWLDGRELEITRMKAMAEYCVEYDQGLPAQNSFRRILIDVARTGAGSFSTFVARRVVQRRELTEAMCLEVVDQDVLDRVLAEASSDLADGRIEKETYSVPERSAFWQSCFGMCASIAVASEICDACAQRTSCTAMHALMERMLLASTGSVDPLHDRKLAGQRSRTAKSRVKRKMLSLAAAGAT